LIVAAVTSVVVLLGIIILVLFIWLYKRRSEAEPALLSSDAYQAIA